MGGWNILGYGIFDKVAAQVDKTHAALRTSLRPPEAGVYGSYRCTLISGVIAAGIAGNSPVWEMRWGQNDIIAIVRKLRIQAVASTTAFAATAADSSFSLFRAQGFTAIDGTGATFAAFTKAKAQAVATRMATSQFAGDSATNRTVQGGIAIANTGAMSGGTRTNDDNAIAKVINRIVASAAAETILTPEPAPYLIDPAECPTIPPPELSMNEGLVLMADAITGTGTWRLMVEVCWDEVDPARYFSLFG
jgi:hypothetical protein